MPLVDAVRCAEWLHIGATRCDCNADFGGVAGRVSSGDEGISVLLEHAD